MKRRSPPGPASKATRLCWLLSRPVFSSLQLPLPSIGGWLEPNRLLMRTRRGGFSGEQVGRSRNALELLTASGRWPCRPRFATPQGDRYHQMKRSLLIGAAVFAFAVMPMSPASAMPRATADAFVTSSDSAVILARGGHGHGGGGHMARGGRGHHYGWGGGRGHHYGWGGGLHRGWRMSRD